MNDKQFERLKKKVTRAFKKWAFLLGLGYWTKNINFHRVPFENNPECVAEIRCRWQYQTLRVEFSILNLMDKDDREIEKFMIHELCHALVNEMREPDEDRKHEERVVTNLTNAIWWTYAKCKGEKVVRPSTKIKRRVPQKRKMGSRS